MVVLRKPQAPKLKEQGLIPPYKDYLELALRVHVLENLQGIFLVHGHCLALAIASHFPAPLANESHLIPQIFCPVNILSLHGETPG